MSRHDQTGFGRVAVLMGGTSGERQVSLDGGRDVLDSLQRQNIKAFAVDGLDALKSVLQQSEVDRVFNILHGPEGEDGRLQGMLDCFHVPYTGTGLLGSALSMNKRISKQVWKQHGLMLATDVALDAAVDDLSASAVSDKADSIGYPLVVKPVAQGSSLGVHLVSDTSQLMAAVTDALEYDSCILLERYLKGVELAVSVLDDVVLPAIAIETDRAFYDYDAKYVDNDTRYLCPCGLGEVEERKLADMTLKAYRAVHLQGWGRVDFIYSDGQCFVIEANTTPGMTSHSLVPKAAEQAGIGFDELVLRILKTSNGRDGIAGRNSQEVTAHAST